MAEPARCGTAAEGDLRDTAGVGLGSGPPRSAEEIAVGAAIPFATGAAVVVVVAPVLVLGMLTVRLGCRWDDGHEPGDERGGDCRHGRFQPQSAASGGAGRRRGCAKLGW